jgi:DNA-binding PadR family transcriptional regulator
MAAKAGKDIVASLDGLDKLLAHRLRLALCVLLARYESMSFSRLKALTGETDGNLGANLRRLEDAQYVRVKKMHVDRKPVSWYTLAPRGRKTLRRHLDALTDVIGIVDD